ncbi:MAG: hypothetical protein ACSHUF_00065 [Candidatus Nasuia deltocephalinicola]
MFNGIINFLYKIYILKYFNIFNYILLKINKNFLDFNIGESFSINGICLTLNYKYFFFLEFSFSYLTFLNICFFKNLFINFEKSLFLFNYINGSLIYGHINNLFLLKNKYIFLNIIKIYIVYIIFIKKYFIYKTSICLDGISLTINEIIYLNKSIIFSLNILKFTYFFTTFKYLKCFDNLNIEIDFSKIYIIKKLFNF